MEKIFKIETTLADDLAELYASLIEEFERKSSVPLAEMNRTLLQTGMIHHLTMMSGLGLVDKTKVEALEGRIDRVARDTIMWDLLQMARSHWKEWGKGMTGTVDFKA